MLKIACIQIDGGIKPFHERITRDGEKMKLVRLYEIINGYKVGSEEERLMLSRKLQCPAFMLFNKEPSNNE